MVYTPRSVVFSDCHGGMVMSRVIDVVDLGYIIIVVVVACWYSREMVRWLLARFLCMYVDLAFT